jgi:hypothetical protein
MQPFKSLKTIITFLIFIFTASFLYPKGIGVCVFLGGLARDQENKFVIHSSQATSTFEGNSGIDLSWKELAFGIYPYSKVFYSPPSRSVFMASAISHQSIALIGGFGKDFKIENSSFGILLSIGNLWKKIDLAYYQDEVTLQYSSMILSIGARLRSPLYKRIFTSIGFEYLHGKNQHTSGEMEYGTPYEANLYGKMYLLTIGLGMEI